MKPLKRLRFRPEDFVSSSVRNRPAPRVGESQPFGLNRARGREAAPGGSPSGRGAQGAFGAAPRGGRAGGGRGARGREGSWTERRLLPLPLQALAPQGLVRRRPLGRPSGLNGYRPRRARSEGRRRDVTRAGRVAAGSRVLARLRRRGGGRGGPGAEYSSLSTPASAGPGGAPGGPLEWGPFVEALTAPEGPTPAPRVRRAWGVARQGRAPRTPSGADDPGPTDETRLRAAPVSPRASAVLPARPAAVVPCRRGTAPDCAVCVGAPHGGRGH